MRSPFMTRWFIILVTIRRCSTKARPTRSKLIIPNCAIIWHVWPVNLVVFRAPFTPFGVWSSCLSLPGIAANSTNALFLSIQPMSVILSTLNFRHSPDIFAFVCRRGVWYDRRSCHASQRNVKRWFAMSGNVLNKDQLLDMYYNMVLIRHFEETCKDLYIEARIG